MRAGAGRKRRSHVGAAGAAAMALMLAFAAGSLSRAAGPLDGILACRRIANRPSRLACFDRESAALGKAARASSREAPEPHAAASEPRGALPHGVVERNGPARSGAPAAAASLDPQQTFGLPAAKILAREEAAERLPRQLDEITARVELVSRAGDGRDVFTLDNHEVWAQLVPDDDLYVKPGDVVKISRAALGSYWLAVQSRRGGCKVTRLQ
jgi:hypothetical protein